MSNHTKHNYTEYELSDEHMRGLIHGAHPSLDLIRKAHFDAWLNKIKAEVWDEGALARAEAMDYFPENPYRTED